MEKRKSVDTFVKKNQNFEEKVIVRRTSDLLLTSKQNKGLKYLNNQKNSKELLKSPSKNKIKGLINSNTILENEFKQAAPNLNKAFKDFSFIQFQNESYRDYMEDRFSILMNFPNDDNDKALFAIFDGHGGSSISEYLCENFIAVFLKYYQKYEKQNIEKILQKCFSTLNDEIKKISKSDEMGSTATIIFITKETNQLLGSKKIIYCANVGDTNCELFGKNNCKRLTYEHRCSDTIEENRIKKNNGNIINGRIGGRMEISRSFGDFRLKDYGLICEPSINKISINFNEKYFLILATDGIWDFVSEEEMFFITMNNNDSMNICKLIVDKAKENGSTDNMTCIIINL